MLSERLISGVVLGPLLFMLYVDDVATLFSSGVVCNLLSDSNVARCLRITEYSLDTLAV